MNLRDNITVKDIECNCGCGFSSVSPSLLDIVQDVREHFKKPIHINSGNHSACRCGIHNEEVDGKKNSKHLPDGITELCRAIDFHIEDVSIHEVYRYMCDKYPNCLGLGKYKTFIHVDDRMKRAYRWDLSH